jgi:hypothetical protein
MKQSAEVMVQYRNTLDGIDVEENAVADGAREESEEDYRERMDRRQSLMAAWEDTKAKWDKLLVERGGEITDDERAVTENAESALGELSWVLGIRRPLAGSDDGTGSDDGSEESSEGSLRDWKRKGSSGDDQFASADEEAKDDGGSATDISQSNTDGMYVAALTEELIVDASQTSADASSQSNTDGGVADDERLHPENRDERTAGGQNTNRGSAGRKSNVDPKKRGAFFGRSRKKK